MNKLLTFTRQYTLPLWPWYLAGLLALAVTNIITLEIPQLAKDVVNALASQKENLSKETEIALLIIGLGTLQMLVRAASRILIFWPGRQIETSVKDDLFSKILRLPQEFFWQHGMGDLISRLANDVGQIRVLYAFAFLQLANMVYLLGFTISKMLAVHPILTAFCLAPLVLMLVITKWAMPRLHRFSKENQIATGALTNRVTEAFTNVIVIQANAAQSTFLDRAEQENEKVFQSNLKLIAVRTVIFPLMICLAGLSQLVVLFYGGNEIIAGRLTVGDILAFNVYITLLTFPLTAIGIIMAIYQRAKTALERIGDIQRADVERATGSAGKTSTQNALLELRDLTFTYNGSADVGNESGGFKLNQVSLQVRSGEKIGFFGPIGSGKSTIFNLITRLVDPTPGQIFYRGRDILSIEPTQLRQEIGYALQSVHLFSESIAANLHFGLAEVPPQTELENAARKAQILGEIEAFTSGWQTGIGERGVRLSGGQKQRLALARLFLRRYPLLILDDVMSAVDQKTETNLIANIYATEAAILIASHRPATLKNCDHIVVLDRGRMVAQGDYAAVRQLIESTHQQQAKTLKSKADLP